MTGSSPARNGQWFRWSGKDADCDRRPFGSRFVSGPKSGALRRLMPVLTRSGARGLSHFLGRPDAQKRETGGKNGDDPLHQGEPRRGQLWIILDNEA